MLKDDLKNLKFAEKMLLWFDQHGRKNLPWHHPRSAYHVWVSEIMLQQTQVQTVIPYYQRFMQSFPDVSSLAQASQDEVLAHWAGLGYYARGRNLHKAAGLIMEQHQGEFPQEYEQILALPGIGRSTAGAILAQAFNRPYAILDGNVKRVLTRFAGIEGWPGNKQVENQLWQWAETLMPSLRLADYTQAMMDLGATVCKRTRPGCDVCPLVDDCQAFKLDRVTELPFPKPKKDKPTRQAWFLLLFDQQNRVAFIQRPNHGIWGGLFSLPEFETFDDLSLSGVNLNSLVKWSGIRHSFSHYHLDMWPVCALRSSKVAEVESDYQWFELEAALQLGLPAPIKIIIEQTIQNKPFG